VDFYDMRKNAEISMINIENTLKVISDKIRKLMEEQKRSKTIANKFNMTQLRDYFVNMYGEKGGFEFDYSQFYYKNGKKNKRSKEEQVRETFEVLIGLEDDAKSGPNKEMQKLTNLIWVVDGNTNGLLESAINMYKEYLNEIRKLSEWIEFDDDHIKTVEGKIMYVEPKEHVASHVELLNFINGFLSTHWDGYIFSRKADIRKGSVEWALRQK
jgi:hypothetical protein